MFKDIDLSAELQRQFDAFRATSDEGSASPVGLDVAILTSSYWPTYPKTTMTLPPALAPSLAIFERFYASKFTSNRRLQWQHNLCHCLLKAHFPAVRWRYKKGGSKFKRPAMCFGPVQGRKELDVSLYQAAVLLLFNDADELPYPVIKERAGIGESVSLL